VNAHFEAPTPDAAMAATNLGTWSLTWPANRFLANVTTRGLLGLDMQAEAFTWNDAAAHIAAKDKAMLQRLMHARKPSDQPFSLVVEVRRGEGKPGYTLLRGRIESDVSGERRVTGVAFDHTHRSRLYEALENSERRFRMLAHGIPNAFFLIDRDFAIEFANDTFATPFGRSPSEMIGLNLADLFGEAFSEHEPHLRQALEGKSLEYEARIDRQGGGEGFLLISNRPAFDEEGRIGGVFSEAADITRLKELERETRTSEAKFRALAEGVPNYLLFLDQDLRVEFCNHHFERMTGWTYEQAVGRHISEILGSGRYADRHELYRRALAGESVVVELPGAIGNDEGFFRFHYQPSFDENGGIHGVFAAATDISAERQALRTLEGKQAELRRSNQDLEQFAYVASHDLKAPLRAVGLLVEWLRADLAGFDSGNVQQNLGLLEQRTSRLTRLLDDLLEYSRVGRKVGTASAVDVGALVRDVVDVAGIPGHITVSIEDALPSIETYATPLEQVFRNLIGNAVKHHPGPAGRISVYHEERDDRHVFCVRDDGDGIPIEHADRIFQMFQTLNQRDEVEGSGMGLAIVSRIVDWQGGRVWFESPDDGRGTVFKFEWKKGMPVRDQELQGASVA
jgi:PAS domain S-box-containing protein